MPQLDFYSYSSQLTLIFILSLSLYLFLINYLLPTIGITLKLRESIIENKAEKLVEEFLVKKKTQKQEEELIEKVNELINNIIKVTNEESMKKEVNYIYIEGLEVEKIIEEDLVEEFLLQNLRKSLRKDLETLE